MGNRVEGLLPIHNKMCVTVLKEKVGKYAPARICERVHYYKREMRCWGLTGIAAIIMKSVNSLRR